MSSLIATLFPLYGTIALGWLAGVLGVMHANAAQVLSRFVFLFAMPVAVFGFFAAAPPPTGEVLAMMGAYTLVAIVMMIGSFLVSRRVLGLSVPEAGAHCFLSACGNAIFLGLPIALSVPGWGQPFLMLMLIEGTLVYGTAAALFQWTSEETGRTGPAKFLALAGKGMGLTLRTPVVVAALAGLALSLARLPLPNASLPGPIADLAAFFGAIAAPAGLFVIGLYITALPRAEMARFIAPIALAGAAKLAIFPVLTFFVAGLLTGWDMALVAPATFFTSMPPAVSAVVQASHFGVYERRAAAALVALTPVSLVTIPILLAVFAG